MIDIRRAGAGDAGELMRLRTVMLEATGPWLEPGTAILRRRLGDPEDLLAAFVVDRPDGAGLAACAVGAIDERLPGPGDPTGLRGYVYNVATDPGYRRRGYSRACMAALLRWYDRRGVTAVDLRASPEAEPLYHALGFRRTGHPAMRRLSPGR
ncbi:GNAT family N-acetyltransferase [Actinoplanes sp. NPDC049118]|uniref:GNAT family N-acetyltransferase n=1 Tax=Actinoplanes sp. NPDC049118 TaxID=3155769 RepID=UPI0033D671B7